MSIDSGSLKFLKEDSHATIQTLGLLGDRYVELLPGSREAESLKPGGERFVVKPNAWSRTS
jgi:ABC-type transporter Mla subunit MlaD